MIIRQTRPHADHAHCRGNRPRSSHRTSLSYWRDGPVEDGGELRRNHVIVGDAAVELRRLPTDCVDTVVTSPPYHLLRRYGGGVDEIGTEPDVQGYVQKVVAVFDELARVLKPSGVAWLNLGDSFSRHARYGAAPKSLLLAPERLLIVLSDRGWIVRGKVVWHKPNHLPASVRDRPAMAWEPLYMLVRARTYYFDLDAIRVPHVTTRTRRRRALNPDGYDVTKPQWAGPLAGTNDGLVRAQRRGLVGHPLGKNPGDVWTIPTAGFRGAHFATFPERLVERPIKATCPERVCARCGANWQRERRRDQLGELASSCSCEATWRPGVVLDPFMGAGTAGVVATRLGRDWIGIELNPEFAAMAEQRIASSAPRGSP